MAACGSLQHIFDKPLETPAALFDPLASCTHINPIKPPTDVFGGFNLTKNTDSVLSSPDHHQRNVSLSSVNSESLSEALGFESFDDIEDFNDQWEQQKESRRNFGTATSEPRRSRISGKEFPPPIPSIGRRVCFKSYRSNGRLILREVKIPTQEILHACREDGRLKLQLIQSDDEEVEDEMESGEEGNNVN